jgi:hypothetical protein
MRWCPLLMISIKSIELDQTSNIYSRIEISDPILPNGGIGFFYSSTS